MPAYDYQLSRILKTLKHENIPYNGETVIVSDDPDSPDSRRNGARRATKGLEVGENRQMGDATL